MVVSPSSPSKKYPGTKQPKTRPHMFSPTFWGGAPTPNHTKPKNLRDAILLCLDRQLLLCVHPLYPKAQQWLKTKPAIATRLSRCLGPPVVPFLTPFLVGRVPLLKYRPRKKKEKHEKERHPLILTSQLWRT